MTQGYQLDSVLDNILLDYLVPLLSTLTLDTFLSFSGTWGFSLNHELPPRPSESYRVGGGVVGGP